MPTDMVSELPRKQLGYFEVTCLALVGALYSESRPSTAWITLLLFDSRLILSVIDDGPLSSLLDLGVGVEAQMPIFFFFFSLRV